MQTTPGATTGTVVCEPNQAGTIDVAEPKVVVFAFIPAYLGVVVEEHPAFSKFLRYIWVGSAEFEID
jgi:hypothetical protein